MAQTPKAPIVSPADDGRYGMIQCGPFPQRALGRSPWVRAALAGTLPVKVLVAQKAR